VKSRPQRALGSSDLHAANALCSPDAFAATPRPPRASIGRRSGRTSTAGLRLCADALSYPASSSCGQAAHRARKRGAYKEIAAAMRRFFTAPYHDGVAPSRRAPGLERGLRYIWRFRWVPRWVPLFPATASLLWMGVLWRLVLPREHCCDREGDRGDPYYGAPAMDA
jgi:hypothetical protein